LYAYSYLDPDHGDKPPGARVAVCRNWATQYGIYTWGNVFLTSAGFEDMEGRHKPHIVRRFLDNLNTPTNEAKVLFIPTAALSDEAKHMADLCKREILGVGINSDNITVYDLDGSMPEEKAMTFDVVYFTGGNTRHLLRRVKETGFDVIVKRMVYANKVYVGVSAGSIIATPNISDPFDEQTAGLSLVNVYLSVHQPEGTLPRSDLPLPHIPLTDNQALVVSWAGYEIIEG